MNLLQTDKPFAFTMRNPNPRSSKNKDGPIYLVTFEFIKEEWQEFMDTNTVGMTIEVDRARVVHSNAPIQKTQEHPYGEEARKLKLSDFFRCPEVWKAIGMDGEFLAWVEKQSCCAMEVDPKEPAYCEGDVVAAHVRRIASGAGTALKPPFSAVPMCDRHHKMQHQKGESAVGGKEYLDEQRIKFISDWAWQALKTKLGVYDHWYQVPPIVLLEWAQKRDVDRLLPHVYREAV